MEVTLLKLFSVVVALLYTGSSAAFNAGTSSSTALHASSSSPSTAVVTRPKLQTGGNVGVASPPSAPPLETPLQMLVDEKREYELALGKAIDTLQRDYPDILKTPPDFDIYSPNLIAVDPTGVQMTGLQAYKNMIKFLHIMLGAFYNVDKSGMTFRLVYDWARGDIRVSWHATIVPKSMFGTNPVRVDGISVYELNPQSGKITKHRIDKITLNDTPLRPPQGIFEAVRGRDAIYPGAIPAGGGAWNVVGSQESPLMLYRSLPSVRLQSKCKSKNSMSGRSPTTHLMATTASDDEGGFEKKNAVRIKFGLPPLSEAEYEELQEQVKKMASRSDTQPGQNGEAVQKRDKEGKGLAGMWDKFKSDVMKNVEKPETCESSWDCEAPKNCCDFGFTKICCYSGLGVADMVPDAIPVRVNDGSDQYGYPEGRGPWEA